MPRPQSPIALLRLFRPLFSLPSVSFSVLSVTLWFPLPPLHGAGLRVPAGFEVTEFAGSALANDIYCLTLDPKGRVVVSGRGYVRLLLDPAGKGRAERALDFAGAPGDGAMGLLWEGDTLYCVGDGGLRRWRDAGGAGRLRPPELLAKLKTGGEHDAHAVLRGPDGWLYVLCGNNTGVTKAHASLPASPVTEPVAGCLLRFPPDFKGCEVVADGFRNAYGMDFNSDGELFTFDSDNERCVSLPWYEPTRCYHLLPGGHYGWRSPQRSDTWRLPPYALDVVAPIVTLGRGSPTGVVCYRHASFPRRYRGGLFLLDWTFGRVWFVPLKRSGSSYSAGRPEAFLRATGDDGFAPTAAAVHPLTGDLYLSVGGRGTRGAVYRVRYPGGLPVTASDVARWQPAPRSLDWHRRAQKELLARATGDDLHARRRALEDALRHRARFTAGELGAMVRANAGQPDRYLRQCAARLLACLGPKQQERVGKLLTGPLERTTRALARLDFDVAGLLKDRSVPAGVRLDAVRLVQRALGGLTAKGAKGTVWEGYSRRSATPPLPGGVRELLRGAFPSGDADLDREPARTLAMVEDDDPATLRKVAAKLTPASHPVEDLHYLIVLARLRAPRPAGVTRRVAGALLDLDRKLARRGLNRDSNWPPRVAELHAGLARRDPALNPALLADPAFGRPDHALFARCAGFARRRAAEVFVARASKDPDYPWNAELVGLMAAAPPGKAFPALRKLWGEAGLDDEILAVLARHPREEDRGRFLSGLTSARPDTVRRSLGALGKLPRPEGKEAVGDEALALLRAWRQLPAGKEWDGLRGRLGERLAAVSGRERAGLGAWVAWYRKAYPEKARRLADSDGVDVAGWERRLAKVDWSAGDARRGQGVFTKASCASCHSGGQALGPDLRGVAGRFSRADLFTAILRPSKDVSPRYRTTAVTTADGKVYQGLVIYEAVDSLILQTGPATTVRLAHKQVSERRLTATSLMPTGLLDRLSDREIADLYAYLKSLGAGKKE
jgi:putative heme-binding domain-containing protein